MQRPYESIGSREGGQSGFEAGLNHVHFLLSGKPGTRGRMKP